MILNIFEYFLCRICRQRPWRCTKPTEKTPGTCGMHTCDNFQSFFISFFQAEITGHEARVKKVCSDGEAMVMQGMDF